MTKALAAQMKTTLAALKQFDLEIEKLCAVHPDFPLFQSLSGAGDVYASRLLPVMGTDRARWTTADELACLSGIAPVMELSGKSVWIRWRYFCPKLMRQPGVPSGASPLRKLQTIFGKSIGYQFD